VSPTTTPARPSATPSQTAATPSPAEGDSDAPVIVLDPGHDRTRPGALGIEYLDTLRSAEYARDALEAAGYRVFITRTDNDTVLADDPALLPLNAADFPVGYGKAWAQASKALQYDPDLVIALHFNGHPDPNVARLEVYYCENGGPQNLLLAEIIREELVAALNSIGYETPTSFVAEDLGVARGNRHFPSLGNIYDAPRTYLGNRLAGIPVVLTEPLYETNAWERSLIEQETTMQALAQAYVRAADRHFGR
jgi:N-acetylmuramoyl-L-alanine amidase